MTTTTIKTLGKVLLTAGLSLGLMSGCIDAHAQEGAPATKYGEIQTYIVTDVDGGAVIGKTGDEGVILYQGEGFTILDKVTVGDEIEVTYGGEHDEILAVEWAK
ncbi:hypothetical protein [Bacillus thuringiensis]|uniref:hypothetical protein n=1 Tax=Bacillus thuringiensis TaxID=1428 RepID=UPI002074D5DC|nr:hypothetical protein [Bacillus thuringiensis]MDA2128689.1 hypothetical protein [Bacillus cereus]MED3275366.1 hypothetical protein [Bacillus thuringiensis]